jgi:hypothetical protein
MSTQELLQVFLAEMTKKNESPDHHVETVVTRQGGKKNQDLIVNTDNQYTSTETIDTTGVLSLQSMSRVMPKDQETTEETYSLTVLTLGTTI